MITSQQQNITLLSPKDDLTYTFSLLHRDQKPNTIRKLGIIYGSRLRYWGLLTTTTIEKTRQYFLSQNNETSISFDVGELSTAIIYVELLIFLVGRITYIFFFCLCFKGLVRRCRAEHGSHYNSRIILHNIDYIVCLLFTSLGALIETSVKFKIHWDYHLVFAFISGWYFMLYFSPFRIEIVFFFTYMIKSGFFEDFVPFASVYCCLLISFTTIMFMLFLGTNDVEEFDSFKSCLLAMFNLGVSLNDIGMLNQARIPWLAHTIFVVFVVLSFIHLFNALIAVMSQTFSGVHDYRNSYALYSKLRRIELFEDIVLFKVKSKYPFKPLFNWAKHWDKDDDDTDDEISLVNKSVKTERLKNGKQEKQVRFYSTMELNDQVDLRDDKEEKKKNMNTK